MYFTRMLLGNKEAHEMTLPIEMKIAGTNWIFFLTAVGFKEITRIKINRMPALHAVWKMWVWVNLISVPVAASWIIWRM